MAIYAREHMTLCRGRDVSQKNRAPVLQLAMAALHKTSSWASFLGRTMERCNYFCQIQTQISSMQRSQHVQIDYFHILQRRIDDCFSDQLLEFSSCIIRELFVRKGGQVLVDNADLFTKSEH